VRGGLSGRHGDAGWVRADVGVQGDRSRSATSEGTTGVTDADGRSWPPPHRHPGSAGADVPEDGAGATTSQGITSEVTEASTPALWVPDRRSVVADTTRRALRLVGLQRVPRASRLAGITVNVGRWRRSTSCAWMSSVGNARREELERCVDGWTRRCGREPSSSSALIYPPVVRQHRRDRRLAAAFTGRYVRTSAARRPGGDRARRSYHHRRAGAIRCLPPEDRDAHPVEDHAAIVARLEAGQGSGLDVSATAYRIRSRARVDASLPGCTTVATRCGAAQPGDAGPGSEQIGRPHPRGRTVRFTRVPSTGRRHVRDGGSSAAGRSGASRCSFRLLRVPRRSGRPQRPTRNGSGGW
jgi:hypothetical protein